MSFHYTEINDLTSNGVTLYSRIPIDDKMKRAVYFSYKYLYFYSLSVSDTSDTKPLGKFIKMNISDPNENGVYSIYEFENESINCNQDGSINGNIYMIAIPDSDEGMTPVENILYKGFPVCFKQ
uniref:Uncharacterized protein n=1 Tax=viral metagenome TaxID=1070528 RepID=A0A6C0I836_9ZZZZ